jgi:hemoglobin
MSTLVEQVGGEVGIQAILDDLYRRLFADPMVGFLFAGHDREHIVAMQTQFTRRLLGDSTASYTGRSIPEAHATLPILPGHFDRRHWLLAEVLREHGVPEEAREAWLRLDRGLRTAVLKVGRARIATLNEEDEDHADPGD